MKKEYKTDLKEVEKELRRAILEREDKKIINLIIKRVILASERVGYCKAMDAAKKLIEKI